VSTTTSPEGLAGEATGVELVSFGYGHGPAPRAHAVVDVRHHFKDPHIDPALRYLTGADGRVAAAVMDTRGVRELVAAIADMAYAFWRGPTRGPVTIAIGCVGGRHRSAVIAVEVAEILHAEGFAVTVTHRDMARPILQRPTAGDAA
jgi:RNase adaptor protein for sRNA GlmZ degradation